MVKFTKARPTPPMKKNDGALGSQMDRILLITYWENCRRHFKRWLKTGKRPTAAEDLEKFDTKFYEVIRGDPPE